MLGGSAHELTALTKNTKFQHFGFYYFDAYKGGSRLNIWGHGFESGDGTYKIIHDYIAQSPEILKMNVIDTISPDKYEHIRLLMCHSADGGVNSFASRLSELTGRKVKGYEGPIVVQGARLIGRMNRLRNILPWGRRPAERFFEALAKGKRLNAEIRVIKNRSSLPYEPRWFPPEGPAD